MNKRKVESLLLQGELCPISETGQTSHASDIAAKIQANATHDTSITAAKIQANATIKAAVISVMGAILVAMLMVLANDKDNKIAEIVPSYTQPKTEDNKIFEPKKKNLCKRFQFIETKNGIDRFYDKESAIIFVRVPGGYDKDNIYIEPFLMAETEITQGTWKKIMPVLPWRCTNGVLRKNVREGDNFPASYVTFAEAKKFCKKIDLMLPDGKQWLYACREWLSNFDNSYHVCGWFDQKLAYPQEVRKKTANSFGLFDMIGNVSEFCEVENDVDGKFVYHRGGNYHKNINKNIIFRTGRIPLKIAFSTENYDLGFRVCAKIPSE